MTSPAPASQPNLPATRSAWVFHTNGYLDETLQKESIPLPPSDAGVLVRVLASSINPVDVKLVSPGNLGFAMRKPNIPNADFAGVVAGGRLEGTKFTIGQEVYGYIGPEGMITKRYNGTLTEYVSVHPSFLLSKPDHLTMEEAAAIPLVGCTSWLGLVERGRIKPGDKVFINGGSGGTGSIGIQIAKAFGAHVTSTSSPDSQDMLSNLGADKLVDYRANPIVPYLQTHHSSPDTQFDIVYDCTGYNLDLYSQSPAYLKPSGVFVDITGLGQMSGIVNIVTSLLRLFNRTYRPVWLGGTPRRYEHFGLANGSIPDILKSLDSLVRENSLKPVIDSVFGYDDAIEAVKRIKSGRAKGKVIIRVGS